VRTARLFAHNTPYVKRELKQLGANWPFFPKIFSYSGKALQSKQSIEQKSHLFLATEGCAMLSKSYQCLAIATFIGLATFHIAFQSAAFSAERSSTIDWGSDLNEALRQASQTGQPVLAHFYSDNCVPCKMLDAKAFKSQALGDAMARTVIPVKIKFEDHRDIAQRYQITRFPTDLFLHPSGEELYRTVSPQDPNDYSKLLDRVAAKNRDWVVDRMSKLSTTAAASRFSEPSHYKTASVREDRPVATQGSHFQASPDNKNASNKNTATPTQANSFCTAADCNNPPPIVDADSIAQSESVFHLASQSKEVKENRYQRQASKTTSPNQHTSLLKSQDEINANGSMASVTMGGVFAEDSTLGLDGFCPVTLVVQKAWTEGAEQFAVRHRGRIYRCASDEARTQFLQDPDRFSPVLSGYDIVHFLETGELIAGKREFGCEYLGRVFVFMNQANKTHFDTHAIHYAQDMNAMNGTDRIANQPNAATMQR
jgi:thiol-disulfide isomerase/thioredoxin/YHS domain-containing protein